MDRLIGTADFTPIHHFTGEDPLRLIQRQGADASHGMHDHEEIIHTYLKCGRREVAGLA